MIRRCSVTVAVVLCLWAQFAHADNEPRLALLIGNAAYKSSPLANPVNDVRVMASALKEAGFAVLTAENASIRDMRRLIRYFGDKLKETGGVGLFYFSGHGVQVRGENYLVSIDSDIRNEDEVADDAVNASVVLEKMQSAGNRMNLVILDACRNNPFASSSRAAAPGLAILSAPSGSLVAYATAPGSVASDGIPGTNGLYTQHLAKLIREPGLSVEEVFKQVRTAVRKDSKNRQTPWENTALEGQFYFKAPVEVATPVPAAVAPTASQSEAGPIAQELALWESVKGSKMAGEVQLYLNRYPSGVFANFARARIAALGGVATTNPDVAKPPLVAVMPAPAEPPIPAANVIGTQITTDSRTGVKTTSEVSILETNAEKTVYSTGDVVSKDGRVLQVPVGDVLLQTVSGSLWTIPLQAGTSGSARVKRLNVAFESVGTLTWRATAVSGGKVQIFANVSYDVNRARTYPAYGQWVAVYSAAQPLPESFILQIAGGSNNGESQALSAALAWR